MANKPILPWCTRKKYSGKIKIYQPGLNSTNKKIPKKSVFCTDFHISKNAN
jgi:hypothetical protein